LINPLRRTAVKAIDAASQLNQGKLQGRITMSTENNKEQAVSQSLEDRKKLLLKELRRDFFNKFKEEHGSRFEEVMDTGEMSVASMIESVGFEVAGIREEELRTIVEAERKILEGTYGICERCGKKISDARLDAEPYAIYCLDCKNEIESEERPKGRLPAL
jgi:DnaK suppressor protein